jgi:hypothetical protein
MKITAGSFRRVWDLFADSCRLLAADDATISLGREAGDEKRTDKY